MSYVKICNSNYIIESEGIGRFRDNVKKMVKDYSSKTKVFGLMIHQNANNLINLENGLNEAISQLRLLYDFDNVKEVNINVPPLVYFLIDKSGIRDFALNYSQQVVPSDSAGILRTVMWHTCDSLKEYIRDISRDPNGNWKLTEAEEELIKCSIDMSACLFVKDIKKLLAKDE